MRNPSPIDGIDPPVSPGEKVQPKVEPVPDPFKTFATGDKDYGRDKSKAFPFPTSPPDFIIEDIYDCWLLDGSAVYVEVRK
jgi:hypothetical protein